MHYYMKLKMIEIFIMFLNDMSNHILTNGVIEIQYQLNHMSPYYYRMPFWSN